MLAVSVTYNYIINNKIQSPIRVLFFQINDQRNNLCLELIKTSPFYIYEALNQ